MADGQDKRPPVNEVSLSVAFEPQSVVIGPRLPGILGDWYTTHPNVQPVPRYTMPIETVGAPTGFLTRTFNFPMTAEQRYWLVSADDSEIVQIQSDYLGLNWRRHVPETPYVGYAHLRERFADLLHDARDGIESHGGGLFPERAEVTYVNIIYPSQLWATVNDSSKLFNLNLSPRKEVEQYGLTFSRLIVSDGEEQGRLHVAVQTAFDIAKSEPVVQLTFTARSRNLDPRDIGTVLKFSDVAHQTLTETFRSFCSAEALDLWGLNK